MPTIHVVTQKKIVRVWRLSRILHEPEQIVVLPVDVRPDRQRTVQPQKHWLAFDYFLGAVDDVEHFVFGQIYELTWIKILRTE